VLNHRLLPASDVLDHAPLRIRSAIALMVRHSPSPHSARTLAISGAARFSIRPSPGRRYFGFAEILGPRSKASSWWLAGEAIGVVSVATLSPVLADALPAELLRQIDRRR
jgi:hypothetical protein